MTYEELLEQYGEEYLYETNHEDEKFFPMEAFEEIALNGLEPMDIFYGARQAYGYTTGDPNSKKTEWFNDDDYFFFDGYGHWVSLAASQVADYLSFIVDKNDFMNWCSEMGFVE